MTDPQGLDPIPDDLRVVVKGVPKDRLLYARDAIQRLLSELDTAEARTQSYGDRRNRRHACFLDHHFGHAEADRVALGELDSCGPDSVQLIAHARDPDDAHAAQTIAVPKERLDAIKALPPRVVLNLMGTRAERKRHPLAPSSAAARKPHAPYAVAQTRGAAKHIGMIVDAALDPTRSASRADLGQLHARLRQVAALLSTELSPEHAGDRVVAYAPTPADSMQARRLSFDPPTSSGDPRNIAIGIDPDRLAAFSEGLGRYAVLSLHDNGTDRRILITAPRFVFDPAIGPVETMRILSAMPDHIR